MDNVLSIFIMITCLKILLIPSYRSTDFEVHRNWLAITHSLPLHRWYTHSTSQWTIDYPPLFAWFEWMLSQIANLVDPRMLQLDNLQYASRGTVLFQRLSVIVTDVFLYIGVKRCADKVPGVAGDGVGSPAFKLAVLVLCSPGLLIVDHIHFQYNGLLLGLLLISIAYMNQSRYLMSALTFCVLVNMKHIYLYMAPAYFVFLLRVYCLRPAGPSRPSFLRWLPRPQLLNCFKLAAVVCSVFAVSFGPFIAIGQLQQVMSRLFPFNRGLSHAYWAPNVWALYNAADKVLVVAARLLGVSVSAPVAGMTGGLVQESDPTLLPSITPAVTVALSAAAMLPALVTTWLHPRRPAAFPRCLAHCALAAFLFGWHVHEKAILLVLVPLAVAALRSQVEMQLCCRLAPLAHCSLLPLLPRLGAVTPAAATAITLHAMAPRQLWFAGSPRRGAGVALYFVGLATVCVYRELLHPLCRLDERLPYLPLLLMSVYCALGIVAVWTELTLLLVTSPAARGKLAKSN